MNGNKWQDWYLLNDPKQNQKSLTFSLAVYTFILLMIAEGLEIANITHTVGDMLGIFISSISLYLGRRINFGGQQYSAEKAEQIEEKIEKL